MSPVVPLVTPWHPDWNKDGAPAGNGKKIKKNEPRPAKGKPADATGVTEQEARTEATGRPDSNADGNVENRNAAGPAKARRGSAPTTAKTPVENNTAKEADGAGTRPQALESARDGTPDDLKMIKGVGPKLEGLLQSMGFYHFDQIANWSADEVAWVDANLQGFKGRVSRDNWVEQARLLAAGGETEFSKKVDDGDVY